MKVEMRDPADTFKMTEEEVKERLRHKAIREYRSGIYRLLGELEKRMKEIG